MTPKAPIVVMPPISFSSLFWSLSQPIHEGKTEMKSRFTGRYVKKKAPVKGPSKTCPVSHLPFGCSAA